MDAELDILFDEVRLLFNALLQRGDSIHADQALTMAQRAVLEYLHKQGAATVPTIARQRRVSRQHIQTLVNPLLESGYLTVTENPEHKRSRLVNLTASGEKAILAMRDRESKFFEQTDIGLSKQQLRKAAATLRAARAAIQTSE